MESDQRQDDKSTDRPQKKTLVYKLVLLGDVYVGKTSIAFRLFSPSLRIQLPKPLLQTGLPRENSQISRKAQ